MSKKKPFWDGFEKKAAGSDWLLELIHKALQRAKDPKAIQRVENVAARAIERHQRQLEKARNIFYGAQELAFAPKVQEFNQAALGRARDALSLWEELNAGQPIRVPRLDS